MTVNRDVDQTRKTTISHWHNISSLHNDPFFTFNLFLLEKACQNESFDRILTIHELFSFKYKTGLTTYTI